MDKRIVARSANSLRTYGASSGRVAICHPSATAIKRYPFDPKTMKAGAGEKIIALDTYGKGHWTRSIAFDKKGKMYVSTVVLPMSLTKGAPHPNAGKLLFEFILSEEGQKIMAAAGELPVLQSIAPKEPDLRPGPGNYRAIYMAPEKLVESVAGWTKVYDEYFR